MARRYDLYRTFDPYHLSRPFVACFNLSTGDIEDAPAPAAIHSFKTRVSDGKIFVTADEERVSKPNMSRLPKVPSNPDAGLTSGNAGVVIVGGGSGAFHSIISLREVCENSLVYTKYHLLTPPEAWIRRPNHSCVQGTELAH